MEINVWSPISTTQKFRLQNKLFQEGTLTIRNMFCCKIHILHIACTIIFASFFIKTYQRNLEMLRANLTSSVQQAVPFSHNLTNQTYFLPFLFYTFFYRLHIPFIWEIKKDNFVSLKIDENYWPKRD